ncbi:phage tail tape measure protein [Streptomyces sp. NPDC004435]|uniref:phage tail tape measure protein n=1 Tax=Streptomyces sp. NPDC004435 TaxID=3364701 RepID=UPI0036AA55DA
MADQRTLRVVIVGNSSQAQEALRDLGEEAEEAGNQADEMGSRFEGLKAGLAGMGAAVLAALPVAALVGFAKGLEEIGREAKLAAQMGLTGADAKAAGDLAGSLYAEGFGDSLSGAGDAVRRVSQDLNMAVDDVDFKPIASKVLTLAETFDQDLGGVTRGVSQLMRTGLASSAKEALDIVAAGFTNGADKAEDFLDTLNEYGTQFRNMGLTGAQATGLMVQGLKAGARDADVVADAVKEFSIEAVKGADGVKAGFGRLDLDANKMITALGKGGTEAAAAFDLTLDKLRAIEDPVKRNSVAFDLFGTKSEDLGAALYALDPSTAVQALGKVEGAASQMSDTLHNNAAAKVEQFKRRLEVGFMDAFASVIVAGDSAAKRLGPVFDRMRQRLTPVVSAVRDQLGPAFSQGLSTVLPTLSNLGQALSTGIVPLFRDLVAIAAPVFGTIASVVTGQVLPALMGLVNAVLPHFQGFVSFLRTQVVPVLQGMWTEAQPVIEKFGQVFATVTEAIGVAIDILSPILAGLWKFLGPIVVGTLSGLWSGIVGVISGALDIIQGVAEVFIGIFTGNWSKAWGGVKRIFSGIWTAIVGVFKVYIYGSLIGILRGGLAKITGLWSSGWAAVRNGFTASANFIKSGVSGWISGIRSVIQGGINFIKSIWSLGWNGIKTTISVNSRGIIAIVKEIPGKITAFFKGLPGQLMQIGRDIIAGLVRGIKNSLGAVMGAVSSIVDKIPGPIKSALGIHSPSRVMAEIGGFIVQGLVVGINGGTKKLAETITKLTNMIKGIGPKADAELKKINDQFARNAESRRKLLRKISDAEDKLKKKGLSKKEKKKIREDLAADRQKLKSLDAQQKGLRADAERIKKFKKNGPQALRVISVYNARMRTLAVQRDKVHSQLVAAQSKLDGLKKAKADLASSITTKAKDYGSFMGALDSSEYGDNSANAILSRLKGKLKSIRDFRGNLTKLAQRGLGKGIINEIAQAGPEEGGQMAQALLNAGGGQIKELNSTYSAIGYEAGKLGSTVAGSYYDAGIRATEGLIKGLKKKESALNQAIDKMAKNMVKALKRALGIKSPSRVFTVLGGFTAQGFERGIRQGQGDVQKAVDELAGTRPTGRVFYRSIESGARVGAGAGQTAAPVVYVTVQGNVTSEKALAKSIATTVRDEIVRTGKRNGGRTGF